MTTRARTLPIEYFRGFTSKHANELSIQLGEGGDIIIIVLNNCEGNPQIGENPTILANFAKETCSMIKRNNVSTFTIDYWKMQGPAKEISTTRRQADAAAFQLSLVDRDTKGTNKFFGVVTFHWDGGNMDARELGLKGGMLRLIEHCNWTQETIAARDLLTVAATKGRKANIKSRQYSDIRALIPILEQNVHRYHADVRVSNNIMGLLVGAKGKELAKLQAEYAVRIKTTSSGFSIEGETESDILEAVIALESRLPDKVGSLGRDNQPIEFAPSSISSLAMEIRYEDVFLNMAGKLCKATVIGSKSIVCYTLLVDVLLDELGESTSSSIVEMELIGLQVVSTRGSNNSWLNKRATEGYLNAALCYSAGIVGLDVEVSFEAMGYAQGNTRRNIHGLMFHDHTLINEDILRQGYCKIMQSARYYNPETSSREDPIRSLFPCMRNLLSKSKPHEQNGLSWCRTEYSMLLAEREAARNGIGIWATQEPTAAIIGHRPTPRSKRYVFIDNSNIWISGKHFSGERQGLGFALSKLISDKLKAGGKQWTEDEVIVGVKKENKLRKFVCDRRPYCASDRGWRLDVGRLLWLIGYDKMIDPQFIVAGSVPPLNEDIWNYMRNLGSINVLTGRTNEGHSSGEDTSLVD